MEQQRYGRTTVTKSIKKINNTSDEKMRSYSTPVNVGLLEELTAILDKQRITYEKAVIKAVCEMFELDPLWYEREQLVFSTYTKDEFKMRTSIKAIQGKASDKTIQMYKDIYEYCS